MPATVSLETLTIRSAPMRTHASTTLNVAIRLLAKTLCGALRVGSGQRGAVDHDVVPAHRRERVPRIGQIGLEVVGAAVAALVDGRREVAAGDAVPGLDQVVDRGRADLAAGAGDEDLHAGLSTTFARRAARRPSRARASAAVSGRDLDARRGPCDVATGSAAGDDALAAGGQTMDGDELRRAQPDRHAREHRRRVDRREEQEGAEGRSERESDRELHAVHGCATPTARVR